ncbi:ATP-binding cassette domain-containing protein [Enterovirga sp.]|uniref:ATP-binding cassette domain-containing protein n=1 Tax=Enterovirga sp. TaxID=2026350 RepID=UPI002C2671FC|nr:ATP-binding cassette domain-containing protein [Enterovirga sp.]HMO27712.1 ATP-binding cassette domain-containing protein [Enterovirga sp.]
MSEGPVLRVENLSVHYTLPRRSLFASPSVLKAVRNVSFQVERGRSLGLVGESGSGKSTTARAVMALERITSGKVHIAGEEITALSPRRLREHRRHFQMVFQDPYGSLDPRYTVGRAIAEPVQDLRGAPLRERIAETLESVGIGPDAIDKYPHQFSGGQRQRIAIARALITRPALIVADEAVSALDVSVQAQVLNLLRDLQESAGISYLFIGHDLSVMQYVCDDIIVMNGGEIVESGPADQVIGHPAHEYTQKLVEATPKLGVPLRTRGFVDTSFGQGRNT